MFDDDRENEPPADGKQFDAVTRYGEPDEPQPGDIGPPIPEAPDPRDSDTEIHPRVHVLFWSLVVVLNIAVLAVGLGLLFVFLGGDLVLGGQLLLAGLVLFAYGGFRYRRAKRELDSVTDSDDASGSDDGVVETGVADGEDESGTIDNEG